MTDYNNIYNGLINEISNILSTHNLSAINFLQTTSPEHKMAHDEILQCISKYVGNDNDKKEIVNINSFNLENFIKNAQEKESSISNNLEYKIAKILHTYLINFYNKYYYIYSGELITLPQKLEFSLPKLHSNSFEDFEINARRIESSLGNIGVNKHRELSLLIMPDGTCYNAQNDHLNCARWLNVNGIDISKAIRFETSKEFYDFNFGSLYNYDFSEKSTEDEYLEITTEQATVIADIYKSLCYHWKYLKPLEKCLLNCKGFGFCPKDYIPELCAKNLSRIENETKGFFNTYHYMRDLKEKIRTRPSDIPTQ